MCHIFLQCEKTQTTAPFYPLEFTSVFLNGTLNAYIRTDNTALKDERIVLVSGQSNDLQARHQSGEQS